MKIHIKSNMVHMLVAICVLSAVLLFMKMNSVICLKDDGQCMELSAKADGNTEQILNTIDLGIMRETDILVPSNNQLCLNIQNAARIKGRQNASRMLTNLIMSQSLGIRVQKYYYNQHWEEETASYYPYTIRYIQSQDGKK